MTQKLSPHKVSKMLELYFQGYSQTQIASKLKINQATVSLHVSKFTALVDHQGLQAAGEENDIMDQVEALHSLSVELKKAKLTVEEARAGVKMELLLQQCGVEHEQYNDVIQACSKLKSEGLIPYAAKLKQLEKSTGMSYDQITTHATTKYQQLQQAQKELPVVQDAVKAAKGELAKMQTQKKQASQELEAYEKKIGVDMNRLKKVEELAVVLKESGTSDQELQGYIDRQQLLNKAGIKIDLFALILDKAKVATSQDSGQGLLKMMSDYGSLGGVIKELNHKVQSLSKQAEGLEEKAKLRLRLVHSPLRRLALRLMWLNCRKKSMSLTV